MGVAYFSRNMVVELFGKRYVLRRKISDTRWQLEDTATHSIQEYDERKLKLLLVERKLKFRLDTGNKLGQVHRIELSEQESQIIKTRKQYVKAVLELPNTQRIFEPVINAVWEKDTTEKKPKNCPDWTTVYRWKKRYLAFGCDDHALIDQDRAKGNHSSRYPATVRDICDDVIDTYYMTRECNSLQATLTYAREQVREAQRQLDEEHKRRRLPDSQRVALPLPKRSFLERLIENIDEFEKYSARHGMQAARVKFRSVKGYVIANAPLERVELDHTLVDLFVLGDDGFPWGRPWVTACIDVFSRCILGIYIGFTPPSALSVKHCLKDALMPKVWLKKLYSDIENEAPCGVMTELVVDHGLEMHAKQLEESCRPFGIEVHFMPRKTPWYKAKIERFFRTLNNEVAHGIQGTSFGSIKEKGDYNAEQLCVVRLSTFRWGVRKWIADVYHQRPHRSLGISPAQMWSENIKPEEIPLPHDPSLLDVYLGRPFQRVLTHKGIRLNNLDYNSDSLTALRMREGSDLLVKGRADDENLGHIYVIWNNEETFEAKALAAEYAEGLSRFEHDVRQKHQRAHKLPNSPEGWMQAAMAIRRTWDKEVQRRRPRRSKIVARQLDKGEMASSHHPHNVPRPPPVQVVAPVKTCATPVENNKPSRRRMKFKVTIRERSARA